jgi:hypothetical protein
MAKLPTYTERLVTTEVPRSTVSGGQIASAYGSLGESIANIGKLVEQAGLEAQTQAGAKSVQRDVNGNLVVEPRIVLSLADEAYNRGLHVAALAEMDGDISKRLNQFRIDHWNNPQAFTEAADAYKTELLSTQSGEMYRSVQKIMVTETARIREGLTNDLFKYNTEMSYKRITARQDALLDERRSIAFHNGVDTPDYREVSEKILDLNKELTNPLFKVPKEELDLKLSRANEEDVAAFMSGKVRRVFETEGYAGAVKLRQQLADLELSPKMHRHIEGQIDSYLNGRQSEIKAQLAGMRPLATEMLKSIEAGVFDDAEVDELAKELTAVGGYREAAKLITARAYKRFSIGLEGETPGARLNIGRRVLGIGTGIPELDRAAIDAGRKYGVDPNFMLRVPRLEMNAKQGLASYNENSGAAGPYQILSSTAADPDIRVENRYDVVESAEGAARLAVRNAKRFEELMGRKPTNEELYLAHQQGADGVVKLLKNPNARAADIVGEDAVAWNGGGPGMTAGDFVGFWTSRYRSANVVPGVTGQMAKAMQQQLKEDFRVLWPAMKEGLSKGQTPSRVEIAEMGERVSMLGDENIKREVSEYFEAFDNARQVAGLGPVGARQVLNDVYARAGDDGIPKIQAAAMDIADQLVRRQEAAIKSGNVLDEAEKQGFWKGPHGKGMPLPQLDFNKPAEMAQTLRIRLQKARQVEIQWGTKPVSLLKEGERNALAGAYTTADTNGKVALLNSLVSAPGLDEQHRAATFGSMVGDKSLSKLAWAGGLYTTAPDIAKSIVQGEAVIQADKAYLPKGNAEDVIADIDQELPAAYSMPVEARETMKQAALARYAFLNSQVGDTSGKLNADFWAQAVSDVAGGIVEQNGLKIVAPERGMGQPAFDATVASIGPQHVQNAVTTGGHALPAARIRTGRFISAGSGRYYVDLKDVPSTDPDIVMDKVTGRPFVIDLRTGDSPSGTFSEYQ